jgi:hypothetical protein
MHALFGAALLAMSALLPGAVMQAQVQPEPSVRAVLSGAQDEANDKRWHVSRCLLGVSYGSPLKVYVAGAVGLRRAFEDRTVCSYGAVHLGLGGARASLGTAVTLGRFGSALGVSGGVLRTFGNPGGDADPSRNYVGGSVHVWPIIALHTEIGAYTRVARAGEAAQRILVWSVGFGY